MTSSEIPSPHSTALDALPRIRDKVVLMWGSPELDVFISRLLMDTRDGTRQGLPVEVATELLFVAELNKTRRALTQSEKLSISFGEAYRLIDAADRQRLETDRFDDPQVSHDTITRGGSTSQGHPPRPREQPTGDVAGPFSLAGYALFKLLSSKFLVIFIIVALVGKAFWPTIKPLVGLITGH